MITVSRGGRLLRAAGIALACAATMGLSACGGRQAHAPRAVPNAAIGVNAYLWRATLDVLSFMPLSSADPYGGVVITDWYSNPDRPTERFKVTVYILDTRLRADGITVSVFKQVADGAGGWVNSPASDQTATDFENAILTKARQLRLSNLQR